MDKVVALQILQDFGGIEEEVVCNSNQLQGLRDGHKGWHLGQQPMAHGCWLGGAATIAPTPHVHEMYIQVATAIAAQATGVATSTQVARGAAAATATSCPTLAHVPRPYDTSLSAFVDEGVELRRPLGMQKAKTNLKHHQTKKLFAHAQTIASMA